MSTVPARIKKAILSDPDARAHFVWRHVVSVPRFRCGVDQAFARHRPELYRKQTKQAPNDDLNDDPNDDPNDYDTEEKGAATELRLLSVFTELLLIVTRMAVMNTFQDCRRNRLQGKKNHSSETAIIWYTNEY